jgi:hypothetical protein
VNSYYTILNPRCYESFEDKIEGMYGGRVLLNNVTKEDEGMYTCLISNHLGKGWRSAFLRVISSGGYKSLTALLAHLVNVVLQFPLRSQIVFLAL